MVPESDIVLDALGSETRRAILRVLESGPRTVGQIAGELPVSRPAVSKHLRMLEEAQLVRSESRGRSTIVELNPAGFDTARAWLDAFWDEALARLRLVAENTEPR